MNFYYDMETVNLDNSAMTTSTPMLNNSTGIDTMMYPITYSSADTSVATVDNSGMITYVGPGQTTVTATLSNPSAERSVTWASTNTSVATVDSVTGELTAVGPGTAQITIRRLKRKKNSAGRQSAIRQGLKTAAPG